MQIGPVRRDPRNKFRSGWSISLARLIFVLLRSLIAAHLRRTRQMSPWWRYRPDLPPGSAQALAASIRGPFGNAIASMCRRHGIGPGHADWPELSRAIVAFGGSVKGFRAGAPAFGLQWWDNPRIVPGMSPGFSAPSAVSTALLRLQAGAGTLSNALPNAPLPVTTEQRVEAVHARLPASRLAASWLATSWLPTSVRHVLARAGPGPSTGPPRCPGLPSLSSLTQRGQSMACPAVLIRAA